MTTIKVGDVIQFEGRPYTVTNTGDLQINGHFDCEFHNAYAGYTTRAYITIDQIEGE